MDNKQKIIYIIGAVIIIILSSIILVQQRREIQRQIIEHEEKILATVPLYQNQDQRSDLQLSDGETLLVYASADSNGNGQNETMVVAQNKVNKKIHIYILDAGGVKLYDNPSLLVGPDKVETKKYQNDSYQSFRLLFNSVETAGYFIRWNGNEYEIIP